MIELVNDHVPEYEPSDVAYFYASFENDDVPEFQVPDLVYLNYVRELPADTPDGYPHLIEINSLCGWSPQRELTIPDIIVTILFRYSREALLAFLDLERPSVFLLHMTSELAFSIARTGRFVRVI